MQHLPSDQDKQQTNESYNLQEMLQKLQERPEEKGELVTRADGTVAYKIKKRKRRSDQPRREAAKKKKTRRIIQIGIAFFLLVAAGVSAAGLLFYYNSSSFREKIFSNIQESTGAKIDVIQFSVQPKKALAREMSFEWPAGNHLQKLDVKFVEASLDVLSFLRKKLGGQYVAVKNATLQMKVADAAHPSANGAMAEELPFNFKTYRCEKTRFEMLASNGKLWSYADNVETSIAKTPKGAVLRLTGGLLHLNGFGKFQMDRTKIAFEDGLAKFDRFAVRSSHNSTGLLALTGDVDLYSKEPLSFDITLEEFPINTLMGHGLASYCKGTADTNTDSIQRYLRFRLGHVDSFEVKTTFKGASKDPFTLVMFPFLHTLSSALATQNVINGYEFDDACEGMVVRDATSTTLSDLYFADDGRLAIRGNISSDGSKLDGLLFVGIGAEYLNDKRTSPRLRKVFTKEDKGFFWASVKVSGSPGAPVDDLEDKIRSVTLNDTVPSNHVTPNQPDPERELED